MEQKKNACPAHKHRSKLNINLVRYCILVPLTNDFTLKISCYATDGAIGGKCLNSNSDLIFIKETYLTV